jgi:hypothetical protein
LADLLAASVMNWQRRSVDGKIIVGTFKITRRGF